MICTCNNAIGVPLLGFSIWIMEMRNDYFFLSLRLDALFNQPGEGN